MANSQVGGGLWLLVVHNVARTSGFYAWPPSMRCETRALGDFVTICRHAGVDDADDDVDNEHVGDDNAEAYNKCCFVCEAELSGCTSEAWRARDDLRHFQCYHEGCAMQCHPECLADHFATTTLTSSSSDEGDTCNSDPDGAGRDCAAGPCPACQCELSWSLLAQKATTLGANEAVAKSTRPTVSKRRRTTPADRSVESGQDDRLDRTDDGASSGSWGPSAHMTLHRCDSQSLRHSELHPTLSCDHRVTETSDFASTSIGVGADERFIVREPGGREDEPSRSVVIDLTIDDDDDE